MKHIPIHQFKETEVPFSFEALKDILYRNKQSKNHPHRHTYYEVFVFTKGGGTHMIDFKEYPIKANHLHFISPGMVHSIKRNASCVGAAITFTQDLFTIYQQQDLLNQIHLYHNHQLAPIVECTSIEMKTYLPWVNQIQNECESNRLMQQQMVLSALSSLLISANRKFITRHALQLPQLFADPRIQAFKNLLDQPFKEKPTVSKLAIQLNLTAKQLTQLLKKNTGLTPLEHITRQLLIEAKRLLVNTDNSIKEIAFALYFEDQAYFGRFFRKQTGLSPLEFRTKMRKKYHT